MKGRTLAVAVAVAVRVVAAAAPAPAPLGAAPLAAVGCTREEP